MGSRVANRYSVGPQAPPAMLIAVSIRFGAGKTRDQHENQLKNQPS